MQHASEDVTSSDQTSDVAILSTDGLFLWQPSKSVKIDHRG
jgi:hypothetical protein